MRRGPRAICAVGYLIERSVGRALPERIAAAHRHAFLSMRMYAEWPHLDAAFTGRHRTLPGRFTHNWFDGDPEAE